MLGAAAPRLQQLSWLDERGEIQSVQTGMLGSAAPRLINLGLLSGAKDAAMGSGFINKDAADQLGNKMNGLKDQANDLKDNAKETASFATNIIDTDAVQAAAGA